MLTLLHMSSMATSRVGLGSLTWLRSYESSMFELVNRVWVHISNSNSTCCHSTDEKLNISFLNITYPQVAPYLWLDPSAAGRDIQPTNPDLFIQRNNIWHWQCYFILYGPLDSHDNEEARSHFISLVGKETQHSHSDTNKNQLFNKIVCPLSPSIVFIKVKKV